MSQDEINNEVQIRLAVHDEKFNSVMASVDALIGEMRDFKNEMRTQNLLRAKEISESRKQQEEDMKEIAKKHEDDMKAINAATDTKISKIETKIDSMTSHIQILTLTAMGGIIAAGVGIAAMVISVLNK